MGSSCGIIKLDIYLSYCESVKCIEDLENNLVMLNYNVMNSSVLLNKVKEQPVETLQNYINSIIKETKIVIICATKNIYKSYNQSIELNSLVGNNFDHNKIIYLILESDFTPDNSYIKHLVKDNWYPFYDDNTRNKTYEKLLNILSINIL